MNLPAFNKNRVLSITLITLLIILILGLVSYLLMSGKSIIQTFEWLAARTDRSSSIFKNISDISPADLQQKAFGDIDPKSYNENRPINYAFLSYSPEMGEDVLLNERGLVEFLEVKAVSTGQVAESELINNSKPYAKLVSVLFSVKNETQELGQIDIIVAAYTPEGVNLIDWMSGGYFNNIDELKTAFTEGSTWSISIVPPNKMMVGGDLDELMQVYYQTPNSMENDLSNIHTSLLEGLEGRYFSYEKPVPAFQLVKNEN